jgi:septal ring-binding cell division protein DamX
MRNNNDEHDNQVEPTLPAETSSDDPSTPTGKTTTSLTKEDEVSLPAETPSNIRTKAAHKKKVVVVSPSPAKRRVHHGGIGSLLGLSNLLKKSQPILQEFYQG